MAVVILGMLIGVVGIGLSIRTIVKKRGWRILSGVLGSVGILVVGFIVFLVGAGISTTDEVLVELKEWQVNVQPASVKSGYHPFQNFAFLNVQKIVFKITNAGHETHEFVAIKTNAAPSSLQVENGRVCYYTHSDYPEGQRISLDPGVLINPGETKSLGIGGCGRRSCSPGTTYVLFSNQPGDYEQGMYTGFTITDPPFINTYWWVVLLAVVVVELSVYFLAIRVRRLK